MDRQFNSAHSFIENVSLNHTDMLVPRPNLLMFRSVKWETKYCSFSDEEIFTFTLFVFFLLNKSPPVWSQTMEMLFSTNNMLTNPELFVREGIFLAKGFSRMSQNRSTKTAFQLQKIPGRGLRQSTSLESHLIQRASNKDLLWPFLGYMTRNKPSPKQETSIKMN